jgi:hypothetical protein
MQHNPITTGRPTVSLVSSEANAIDGISLREWILPLPATHRILRLDSGGRDHDEQQRSEM